jgi:hypothetical protein
VETTVHNEINEEIFQKTDFETPSVNYSRRLTCSAEIQAYLLWQTNTFQGLEEQIYEKDKKSHAIIPLNNLTVILYSVRNNYRKQNRFFMLRRDAMSSLYLSAYILPKA